MRYHREDGWKRFWEKMKFLMKNFEGLKIFGKLIMK